METTRLPHLPAELLEQIFQCTDPSDKTTCAAVAASCRLGHDIATPLLYETIVFEEDLDQKWQEHRHDWIDTRARKIAGLGRTLLENPSVCRLVRSFSFYIDEAFNPSKCRSPQFQSFTKEAFVLIEAVIAKYAQAKLDADEPLTGSSDALVRVDGRILDFNPFEEEMAFGHRGTEGLGAVMESILNHRYANDGRIEIWALIVIYLCRGITHLSVSGRLIRIPNLQDLMAWTKEPVEMKKGLHAICPSVRDGGILHRLKQLRLSDTAPAARIRRFDLETVITSAKLDPMEALILESLIPCLGGLFWHAHLAQGYRGTVRHLVVKDHLTLLFDLGSVLTFLPELRSFTLELSCRMHAHQQDWKELGDGLRRCTRLQSLSIVDCDDNDRDILPRAGTKHCERHNKRLMRMRKLWATPGLGLLGELQSLSTMIITETALFGHGQQPDYIRNLLADNLDNQLPRSLTDLTIVIADREVTHGTWRMYMENPRFQELDKFKLMGCERTHWYSESGEGGVRPKTSMQWDKRTLEHGVDCAGSDQGSKLCRIEPSPT